jgi:L-ascorbate metabolism protein UlaG (beta-lactamase superfamily)
VSITKFEHSCLRIEHDGKVIVIDPGSLTSREAVGGADAVLIAHEHSDHWVIQHLRATAAAIFTIDDVAREIALVDGAVAERTTVVKRGQEFAAAGMQVRTIGELHEIIPPDIQRIANTGFLVTAGDQKLFHPGDAFTAPGTQVDVLCTPVAAPWARLSDVLDYARSFGAPLNLAIHEMVYSGFGLASVDTRMRDFAGDGNEYVRLQPGQDL